MTRKTTWQGITRAYTRRVLRERGFNGDLITDAYGHGHTRVQNTDGMNAVVSFGNTDVDTYDVELFPVTAEATDAAPAEVTPGTYYLEIMRRDYDTEDYHDGDRGECLREVDDSRAYGDAYDTEDIDGNALTPVAWAVKTLRPMAEFEPSVYPIPGTLGAHTWLSANVPDNYTSIETEVTVYLTGDWTDAQRAEVFRGVTARAA